MKKIFLLASLLFTFFGFTFAISQTVNETNGVNYGYIHSIYKTGTKYFLSVDYVQYYKWYEAVLARAEDGMIFWDLDMTFNQDYPTTSYTTNASGYRIATRAVKRTISAYLTRNGQRRINVLLWKMNNYTGTNSADLFNGFTQTERMIIWPAYDPATWWGWDYVRNTTTKLRKVQFGTSPRITVEGNILSLDELVTWAQHPTQLFLKVFLQRGKIEWFRVEYHP